MRTVFRSSAPILLAPVIALTAFLACASVAFAAGAGVVTLTFDDGNTSQYTIAAPIMKTAGQKAVYYINSGWVGQPTFMTWAELAALRASGSEIAGHTVNHTELPTVPLATATTEVNQDYANFVAHGITPKNFATPFGAYDNNTLPIIAKTYDSHRAFANQGLNVWPYNKYLLYVRYITNQTTVDQAKAWVSEAMAQDAWLVLVFHEILPTVDPTDDYSWQTAQFQQFITYLNSQQIKAKTIEEVLQAQTNLVANSSFESGLTSWSTNSPTSVIVNTGKNGSYPSPTNSIQMVGGASAGHLFSQKIPVLSSATYGLRVFTDSRSFTSGEAGFYIDEYDQNGNWLSGKWLGGIWNKNVIDKSYVYKPTSGSVHTASIQVYMTAGTVGSIFIDNVELFARTQITTTNLLANPSFESGFTNWRTDNATNVILDTANNGGAPNAKNSVKMTGNVKAAHLFGDKVAITFGTSYGLKAYTDSRSLVSGEVGFYVDEYDLNGNWLSGKWVSGFTDKTIANRSYVYTPTSASVKTVGVQVYMTKAASGSIFIDSLELFAR